MSSLVSSSLLASMSKKKEKISVQLAPPLKKVTLIDNYACVICAIATWKA